MGHKKFIKHQVSPEETAMALAEIGFGGEEEKSPPVMVEPKKLPGPARNSEIALAKTLIKCLQAKRQIVSTQGLIWQYLEETGTWEPSDRDSILALVDGFDGAKIGKRQIFMSNTKAQGVYASALRHHEIYEPDFFENSPVGVQCQNGFLAEKEGRIKLVETSPDNRARFILPLEYKDNCPQKRWRDFLMGLFPGDRDASEKCELLQEFVGLCLVGKASQFAKVLVLTGTGANGKSTFMDHVARLFPQDGLKSVIPQKWKEEYYLAQLRDSLLNICNEMPTTEIMGSDSFKAVVTGERLSARLPYQKPFNFIPTGGHLFACNALPYVTDHTKGFWRRFLTVEFTADFSRGEVETKEAVLDRLEKDLGATLTWAIIGANRVLRRGAYTMPESCQKDLERWRTESDSVALWVLEGGVRKHPERTVLARTLYEGYSRWAKNSGYRQISSITFSQRLVNLGFRKTRRQKGIVYFCRVVK